MEIETITSCKNVDWYEVVNILKTVGMSYRDPEAHRRAFEASHTTVLYTKKANL